MADIPPLELCIAGVLVAKMRDDFSGEKFDEEQGARTANVLRAMRTAWPAEYEAARNLIRFVPAADGAGVEATIAESR